MFCGKCGSKLEEGTAFCTNCGNYNKHNNQTSCSEQYAYNQKPKGYNNNNQQYYDFSEDEYIEKNYSQNISDGIDDKNGYITDTPVIVKHNNLPIIITLLVLLVIFATAVIILGLWYMNSSTENDNERLIGMVTTLSEEKENSNYEDSKDDNDLITTSPADEMQKSTEVPTETPTMVITVTEKIVVTEQVIVPVEPVKPVSAHRYEAVQSVCTWEEANARASSNGGRLAEIHSNEDWNMIISALSGTGIRYAWLGGREELSADKAFYSLRWESGEDISFIDPSRNPQYWYPGEPSNWDRNSNYPEEPYLLIWYVNDYWSMNDCSNDLLNSYKSERIGYVIEYDW